MLSSHVALGGDPDRFWRTTPLELRVEQRGRLERIECDQVAKRSEAWVSAALNRSNKLPDYSQFVAVAPQRPQTEAELTLSIERLAAAWGAEDRR